jgi:MFS family permease
MFAEAARPAFSAMMIDVVPERDRLRAFSLNYWAINLGFACAAVLAGFAAEASYLLLFAVNAATTLITASVIFVLIGETRPDPAHRPSRPGGTAPASGVPSLSTVLRDRIFLGFVALNVLVALIFLQHLSMLPIAMGQDGLPPTTYGWVIALNGVLIVAGQLFVPRIIRGRSRSHVLALAALISGAGFGLTALADAAWIYAATVLIWTVGEMLQSPSNSTLIAELSPAALRGRYQGVFSLSWSLAGMAAPVAGGLVWEHAGNAALWLGCAAIGAFVGGAHLASGPARERRAAQLRSLSGATEVTVSQPEPAPSAPAAGTPTGNLTTIP